MINHVGFGYVPVEAEFYIMSSRAKQENEAHEEELVGQNSTEPDQGCHTGRDILQKTSDRLSQLGSA